MKKFNLFKIVGITFILMGVILNEWILAKLFTENNHIDNNTGRLVIWIIDVLFIFTGFISVFFLESLLKNNKFRTVFNFAKSFIIVIFITGIFYYIIDYLFGIVYPIKPWEKELSIMSSPSYITQPYYSKEFIGNMV